MTRSEYMYHFLGRLRIYSRLHDTDLAARVSIKTSLSNRHDVEIYIDGVMYMLTDDYNHVNDHVYAVVSTIGWDDMRRQAAQLGKNR